MELHSSVFLIKVEFTCNIILASGVQHRDFPEGTVVKKKKKERKKTTCSCRRHRRCGFVHWVKDIPWRRKWQPTPVFLPEKSHGQRTLVSYRPWGCKASGAAEHTHLCHITFDICIYCEIITIIRIL